MCVWGGARAYEIQLTDLLIVNTLSYNYLITQIIYETVVKLMELIFINFQINKKLYAFKEKQFVRSEGTLHTCLLYTSHLVRSSLPTQNMLMQNMLQGMLLHTVPTHDLDYLQPLREFASCSHQGSHSGRYYLEPRPPVSYSYLLCT